MKKNTLKVYLEILEWFDYKTLNCCLFQRGKEAPVLREAAAHAWPGSRAAENAAPVPSCPAQPHLSQHIFVQWTIMACLLSHSPLSHP